MNRGSFNMFNEKMIKKQMVMISYIAIFTSAIPAFANESGIIKNIHGQVQIERGGLNLDAKVGDSVNEKDRITAKSESSVGISMNDETLLSIGQNSSIIIDKYTFNPVTRDGRVETSILKGTLRFVTGLIGQKHPEAIALNTPVATIGIRGTDFIVEVPDDQ
jgi:hypothetical protein